jgi:hypothetical protein
MMLASVFFSQYPLYLQMSLYALYKYQTPKQTVSRDTAATYTKPLPSTYAALATSQQQHPEE